MLRIEIYIGLNPVSKKNSMKIVMNRKTGRPFIVPSDTYRKYERQCGAFLIQQRLTHLEIGTPVNVKCLFYMSTRRKVDMSNLLEAVDDVLVKYGVILDDNYTIVAGHDGSRVLYDKENPRTEIVITEMEE